MKLLLSFCKLKISFSLFLGGLFITTYTSAQKFDSIAVPIHTDKLNNTESKILVGVKLSMTTEIVDAHLDTTNQLLAITTLLEKNRKSIVVYDLKAKNKLWERAFNSKKYRLISLDNYILLTSDKRTMCLNKVTGEELWKLNSELIYVNNKNEVAFTYFSHFDSSRPDILLEAIRLKDGKKIWKRDIDRVYGWNEIINVNDSTVILSASGLHSINLKNGKGWDYDALTGASIPVKINPLWYFAYFSSAVLLGPVFAFPLYYFTNTNDVLWDLCSNMIVKDGYIYFASKQTICALDLNGNKIWQTQLPSDISGNSRIVLKDSMLVLINKGSAAKGQEKVFYGTPYLASFNLLNGKQTFLRYISMDENAITDFKLQNGSSFLIQKDKLTEYSEINGEFMNRVRIIDLEKLKGSSFISADNFISSDHFNSNLSTNNDSLLYIFIPEKGITVYNQKLTELAQLSIEKLYFKFAHSNHYNLYKNKEEVVITDLNLNKLYTLKTPKKSFYNKGNLLVYEDNSVSIFTID